MVNISTIDENWGSTWTPYTKQFEIELNPAKRAENYAREVLEEMFGVLTPSDNIEAGYDLFSRSTRNRIEVKYDKLSRKTGRVAIEYEAYGKPKGIEETLADHYFIICYDKDWFELKDKIAQKGWWIGILIKTEKLKGLVNTMSYNKVSGGDNNGTKMHLVPVEDIREESVKIYPIK